MMNEILRMLNDLNITADQLKLAPENLAAVIKMVDGGTINNATAKTVLAKAQQNGKNPANIVAEEGLGQVSDESALKGAIDKVLAAHPEEVESFRGGKEGLFGWFMGQVMRETRGKADPARTRELLEEALTGKN
jgi:aspartyl-tRNA(Asn)/glutamyl-tRNA(Gln) amidotransferase subunit B